MYLLFGSQKCVLIEVWIVGVLQVEIQDVHVFSSIHVQQRRFSVLLVSVRASSHCRLCWDTNILEHRMNKVNWVDRQ